MGYFGEAASGLFQGMHARDQLDLQQGILANRSLLLARQMRNQQMENFLKLSEIVGKNPVAGLEMVRGANPEDLSDTHRAALLVRAHSEIPDYMKYQESAAKVTGLPQGAARYVADPRLYREAMKDDRELNAIREILDKTDDPIEAGQLLSKAGVSVGRLKEIQEGLFPAQMAKLKGFQQYWDAYYKQAGQAGGLKVPAGTVPMPGGPMPVAEPGTESVGDVLAGQKGLEAKSTESGKIAGEYQHPLKKELDQSLVELRRAQTLLEQARLGAEDRKSMEDSFKNLQRMAETLRTLNNYRFENRIFADPKHPEPVIDLQTGEALSDKIEKAMAALAMKLNISPEQAHSMRSVEQSRTLRGRVPAPVPPASQVPTRPNILDIKRLD